MNYSHILYKFATNCYEQVGQFHLDVRALYTSTCRFRKMNFYHPLRSLQCEELNGKVFICIFCINSQLIVTSRSATIVDRRPLTNDILQSVVGHQSQFASDVRWLFTFQRPIRCFCHVIHKIPIVDNKISDGIECRLAVS